MKQKRFPMNYKQKWGMSNRLLVLSKNQAQQMLTEEVAILNFNKIFVLKCLLYSE